jgi:glycosyltransferase involved in cell wall biosynthesis
VVPSARTCGPASPAGLRVTWEPDISLCSIVIPTRDAPDLIRTCLTSILQLTTGVQYEVLLVDNDSTDPATLVYYEEITRDPRVGSFPIQVPSNFSVAVNRGAAAANGDAILLLNNDMQVLEADWLARLAQWLTFPEIGVVGALLLYPTGLIQHAGLVVGLKGSA